MNSMIKKIIFVLTGIGLILTIWLFGFKQDPVVKKFKELEKQPLQKPLKEELDEPKFHTGSDGQIVYDGELTIEQMASILRKKYGQKIHHPGVQVGMLEKLIRDLKTKYGDRWVEMLQQILGTAFPQLETALFRLSENIYKYNKYLEMNHKRLSSLSNEDRQKELWKMRREMFGESSEDIWAGERKNQNITTALKNIEESKNLPMKEKLNMYSESLKETYGKELPSIMDAKRQMVMDAFLNVVQDDLSSMSAQERKGTLREIRKTMGMDGNALQRWEALDAERDSRWENSEKYKNERKGILARYSGQEREQKLDDIRKKYYGEEAESVKNEEAGGFFRYEQKRQWGID